MTGRFISFEGNEGSGKSTQIKILAECLAALGRSVITLREPGGTPIGEEIRHLLKHSAANIGMTAETELLLMNASRAQLVRQIIRPALVSGAIVLCDRFYDSTTVYQGTGRGLDPAQVKNVIDLAVGDTRPELTLFLEVPLEVSEERRRHRSGAKPERDRFEEAGRAFFERIHAGYEALANSEAGRIRRIDATRRIDEVSAAIWSHVSPLVS